MDRLSNKEVIKDERMVLLHNNRFIRLKLICSIPTTTAKHTHTYGCRHAHVYTYSNPGQPEHVPASYTHTHTHTPSQDGQIRLALS